ncbi:MAG: phosphotyrosine protein phosphatase [Planctomycetes bacterium]|nr:phosphotyrosine protein phosphatase [Planctomycetota bacterium]MCB9905517.1 phosphotyrosine protein phosphatase [Planctomycetota bacterium]
MTNSALHLLFVCSRNRWRSPTAERIYARAPGVASRSRGLSPNAARRLTAADVRWADLVFVMEAEHQRRLRREFGTELEGRAVHVLDIPDDYGFMDPELVELISSAVDPHLDASL